MEERSERADLHLPQRAEAQVEFRRFEAEETIAGGRRQFAEIDLAAD
ncbi:MAG: hypothetical protein WDN69_18855 [Aliidongia sp.]